MAVFSSQVFFGGVYFTDGGTPVVEVVKTGTGGIDPKKGRFPPVKPTLHLPKKQTRVEQRIDESREIQAEIAGRLAREFSEETAQIPEFRPIQTMSMSEVEAEIGFLLRKKIRTEEDEVLLLLLMVSVVS